MDAFATPEQLATWLDVETPPANAERLLLRASELVDSKLALAVYDVDNAGAATDNTVLTALADAACAQVEFWLASDEEDDILGPVESLSLGSMTVSNGSGPHRVAPFHLAPRAARALRNCPGLLW